MKKIRENIQYIKSQILVLFGCSMMVFSSAQSALIALDDGELSDISGQALLDINKYNYKTNNFYRIGMNATVTTSVNIDKLVLRDGAGNAQIDIDRFSLNGGDTSNSNHAVSSGTLTNPYVEFAFKGDADASTGANNEIIGIRFGAEEINGTLSFGDTDRHGNSLSGANPENGLNAFRGYMQTLAFSGEVRLPGPGAGQDERTIVVDTTLTAQLVGSLDANGTATIPLLDNGNQIVLGFNNSTGVILDSSQTTPVDAGGDGYNQNGVFTTAYVNALVNATAISKLESTSSSVVISGGSCGFNPICHIAAALLGEINPLITVTNTTLTGDHPSGNIPLFLNESIKLFHKVEANSSGFFLSAQNEDLIWKNLSPAGTGRVESATTAGWWMEFLDPVDIGSLIVEDYYLPDNVVNSIGVAVNAYINNQPTLSVGDALAALGHIEVDGLTVQLQNTQSASLVGAPASLGSFAVVDRDISINSQVPIRNCWNGVVGC